MDSQKFKRYKYGKLRQPQFERSLLKVDVPKLTVNKRVVSLGNGVPSITKIEPGRRVYSMNSLSDGALVEQKTGPYTSMLQSLKETLLSTSKAIWRKVGPYDNGESKLDFMHDKNFDFECSLTGEENESNNNVYLRKDDNRSFNDLLEGSGQIQNYSEFSSAPNSFEMNRARNHQYGTSLIRRSGFHNSTSTKTNHQPKEIEFLRMMFDNTSTMPAAVLQERKRQLALLKKDESSDYDTFKMSVGELTEKIKNTFLNNAKTLVKHDIDVSIINEQKLSVPVEKKNQQMLTHLKFDRFLTESIEQKLLRERYQSYEHEEEPLKRKLRLAQIGLIPKLSRNDVKNVESILNSEKTHLLKNSKEIQITIRDFKTLSTGRWLNDTIVESFMIFLEKKFTNVAAFNSFFYTNLAQRGYPSVKKWLKRKKKSLGSITKLIVPINLNESHWVLAAIDLEKKVILQADSMSTRPTTLSCEIHDNLKTYLYEESGKIFGHDFVPLCLNCPQQNNGFDCGIYMCLNALCLCMNESLTFNSEDAIKMRTYIGHLIITP